MPKPKKRSAILRANALIKGEAIRKNMNRPLPEGDTLHIARLINEIKASEEINLSTKKKFA